MNEHAFHSRSEFKESRAKSGYGTLRQRLGEDSQLSFGHCCLSLKPAVNPVCTPSGHLYSKEVIYEYLLNKISSLDKEKKAYEEQQASLSAERNAQSQKRKHEEIEKFIHTQESVADVSSEAEDHKSNSVLDRLSKKIDTRSKEQKVSELAESSPWLPQFAPEAEEKLLKQPRRRPPSPITGADLRLKDLYPVELEISEDGKSFLCAVTKKEIKYQPMVLIRKSKKVMTKESFDKLAKKSRRCPVTNVKFKDKDVITLQSGNSSFAASAKEKAQAKRHRPNFQ